MATKAPGNPPSPSPHKLKKFDSPPGQLPNDPPAASTQGDSDGRVNFNG